MESDLAKDTKALFRLRRVPTPDMGNRSLAPSQAEGDAQLIVASTRAPAAAEAHTVSAAT